MNFIKRFFLTSSVLVALILGLIYSVDPYDKFGFNLFGFKTKAVAMARENKFNMFEHARKNYEAVILGSSSAHRMHTEDVEALTGLKTFNYAVQHTTPEDYLAVTRHVLSKSKPKLILLQLDFYGLNANFKTDTRFYTSPLKKYLENNEVNEEKAWFDTDYFTLGALSDAFKVIWVNAAGKARHLYVEDGNYHFEKQKNGPLQVSQFSYENYHVDQNRIGLLRDIRELCRKNNVRLIVWTGPYSYEHTQKILLNEEIAKDLADYKSAITGVFGEVFDFNNESMKDFNSTVYFNDSSHPRRELFKLILTRVLKADSSPASNAFGQKLTN